MSTRTPKDAQLRDILCTYFDLEELQDLCMDVEVDFDSLRGEGCKGKSRELVKKMKRESRLPQLAGRIVELRPKMTEQEVISLRSAGQSPLRRTIDKFVLAVVLVCLIGAVMWMIRQYPTEPAVFVLENPYVRPDTPVRILAQNAAAKRKSPLNVRWKGLEFANAGTPDPDPEIFRWTVALHKHILLPKDLQDGEYVLELAFPGEPYGPPMRISIYTKPPDTQIELTNGHTLKGVAKTQLQIPDETLQVDVFLRHEGQSFSVPLLVERKQDGDGRVYFEFETNIEGFPEFTPDDPRYAEPFFGFQVTDQAGNTYYNSMTYAQFIASGTQMFGSSAATIYIPKTEDEKGGFKSFRVRVVPQTQFQGNPAIRITAIAHGSSDVKISLVSSALNEYYGEQLPYLVFRDQQNIALVVDGSSEYIDQQPPQDQELRYHIEQQDKEGRLYASNEELVPPLQKTPEATPTDIAATAPTITPEPTTLPTPTPTLTATPTVPPKYLLRSTPQIVSIDDYKQVFGLDDNRRPQTYITNQYEDRGNVVFDHATGLAWQKSGSPNMMNYADAQEYVKHLNKDRFAGHDDWRLPTVPELMSLLEPKKQSNDLYINPIFDEEQWWCWSADSLSSGGSSLAWHVSFNLGAVNRYDLDTNRYVRLVRP